MRYVFSHVAMVLVHIKQYFATHKCHDFNSSIFLRGKLHKRFHYKTKNFYKIYPLIIFPHMQLQ